VVNSLVTQGLTNLGSNPFVAKAIAAEVSVVVAALPLAANRVWAAPAGAEPRVVRRARGSTDITLEISSPNGGSLVKVSGETLNFNIGQPLPGGDTENGKEGDECKVKLHSDCQHELYA
jgi:hypothetical protein